MLYLKLYAGRFTLFSASIDNEIFIWAPGRAIRSTPHPRRFIRVVYSLIIFNIRLYAGALRGTCSYPWRGTELSIS